MIRAGAFPDPPYWVAVFISKRRDDDGSDYSATAARMAELAAAAPGFLGVESARRPDGVGITVAFFETEGAVRAWKLEAEHRAAQLAGRERWYEEYAVWVAQVDRAYTGTTSPLEGLL